MSGHIPREIVRTLDFFASGAYIGVNFNDLEFSAIDENPPHVDDFRWEHYEDIYGNLRDHFFDYTKSMGMTGGLITPLSEKSNYNRKLVLPSWKEANNYIHYAKSKFPDYTYVLIMDSAEKLMLRILEPLAAQSI